MTLPASKRFIDMTGTIIGRLIVVSLDGPYQCGARVKYRWNCRCDCGVTIKVESSNLRNGHTSSCGCLRVDSASKHSLWGSPTYQSWSKMIQRCENPNALQFDRYGGRGITICKRWHDFANFVEDVGIRPSLNHSIDRIQTDGNYDKDNCRWSTRKEQMRNRRNNVNVTIDGETQCLKDWAAHFGIHINTVRARMKNNNWDAIRALTTPTR